MRRFTHWTPRYVADRLSLLLYEKLHPDAPWLTRSAIDILNSWLRPSDRGLEWGAGRSTIWLAQRLNSLVSIEHDEGWHTWVRARLDHLGLRNVDIRCVPENEYITTAEALRSKSLDFVLVDGLERDLCAVKAVSLLKPGGLLVLDDCNRYLPSCSRSPDSRGLEAHPASETWARFLGLVGHWRCIWTSNGVSDTCLWVKPEMN